jgi:hypothetical protein
LGLKFLFLILGSALPKTSILMNQIRSRSRGRTVSTPKQRKKNWLTSAADWLTLKLGLDQRLTAPVLAKILWVGLLAIVYIYFQHNFDRLIRKTEQAETVLEQKRAMYISHKSRYLFASKQSEIEKKLEGKGFTNAQSPVKISTSK